MRKGKTDSVGWLASDAAAALTIAGAVAC